MACTGITPKRKTVLKIINYLRAEGRLKSTFDPVTGDLIVYEIDGLRLFDSSVPSLPNQIQSVSQYQNTSYIPQETSSPTGPNTQYKICPYCGTAVPPGANFCPNCGATLR